MDAATNTEQIVIGASFEGGIYAGLTIHENKPHALILLPGDADSVNWKDACAFAEKQGGALPSRIDQLVLLQNVKGEFKEEWYWSGEEFAHDAGSAWSQSFGLGGQDDDRKGYYLRARAVRRLPI